MQINHKEHWEKVYKTKKSDEVSWIQKIPSTSLALIKSLKLNKTANIIDVGAGDSNLVDYLLDEGFKNLTVLDISSRAQDRAKKRLGEKAKLVKWITSDITEFSPNTFYDLWHDRASFHFLTKKKQIETYVNTVNKYVKGNLILATFSKNGPQKCSGLQITQYSDKSLNEIFKFGFKKTSSLIEDHQTPFGTKQNFLFCGFKKI
tara:strand:- start:1887 stop:2498 length:612 start_codon:yes stop_codon:yes gene_type:complete